MPSKLAYGPSIITKSSFQWRDLNWTLKAPTPLRAVGARLAGRGRSQRQPGRERDRGHRGIGGGGGLSGIGGREASATAARLRSGLGERRGSPQSGERLEPEEEASEAAARRSSLPRLARLPWSSGWAWTRARGRRELGAAAGKGKVGGATALGRGNGRQKHGEHNGAGT